MMTVTLTESMPWLRLHHVFAMSVWEGRVYWSDWETRAVESCRRRPRRGYKVTCPAVTCSTCGREREVL